jgi:hypothetical protein
VSESPVLREYFKSQVAADFLGHYRDFVVLDDDDEFYLKERRS